MSLSPDTLLAGMSNVQKLVHLAARLDSVDVEDWRSRLLRARRQVYEDELTIQARRVGCPGQRGRLGNGSILSALNDESQRDAESIVNTFNYYLAVAIINIGQEVPTANRHVYAYRLTGWQSGYWGWKQGQIDQMTEGTARSRAQQDFYAYNRQLGTARVLPLKAVCPICQGWIARGVIPLRVALDYPPPYHNNCPHYLSVRADQVDKSECHLLWMGS